MINEELMRLAKVAGVFGDKEQSPKKAKPAAKEASVEKVAYPTDGTPFEKWSEDQKVAFRADVSEDDLCGRIMGHAYNDEMGKIAGVLSSIGSGIVNAGGGKAHKLMQNISQSTGVSRQNLNKLVGGGAAAGVAGAGAAAGYGAGRAGKKEASYDPVPASVKGASLGLIAYLEEQAA